MSSLVNLSSCYKIIHKVEYQIKYQGGTVFKILNTGKIYS